MSDADLRAPRPVRLAALVAAGALHLAAIALLVKAFAPDFTAEMTRRVVSTFTVTVTAPEPSPTPLPAPSPAARAPEPAGAAGNAGRKASPRAVAAPPPRIVLARPAAPPVAGSGSADRAGAAAAGAGTGAGGSGTGTGSGASGSGTGGGGSGHGPVKIAGDINSARDYPVASRELRLGDHVVIWLTVGTDGRPTGCKVARASRDPAADAITCKLALARFRFRPALDANGAPVVAVYGWQQRWFLKE